MSRGGLGLASYISFGLERETPKGRRLLAFDFTMSRGLGLASYISFGLDVIMTMRMRNHLQSHGLPPNRIASKSALG